MVSGNISGHVLVRLLGSWRRPGPAYRALADSLRLAALDGRVPLGTRLPGERDLAEALGVSRTTVASAYAALRESGYLVSRRGSGSRTSLPQRQPSSPAAGMDPGSLDPPDGAGELDLAHASLPAPEGALPQAAVRASEQLARFLPGYGYDTQGLPDLRAVVAEHYTRRGLPSRAEEVLITFGAQHAFALVLRLLAGPGDRVLVESPTYPNALEAIRGASARAVPAPFPADSPQWDTDLLAATIHQAAPRVAYLIPDFQNPTGRCMDSEGRQKVAELASRTRTPVVIDETLAQLWLDGQPPPPPVAAFDRSGVVISVGTMSKSFWGGLRVGWIRAGTETIRRIGNARISLDLGPPVLDQLVAAELLTGGDDVLDHRRVKVEHRRDTLVRLLGEALPEWRFSVPGGGLALWCEFDKPVSSALAAFVSGRGVRLAPGPRFGPEGTFERYLRIPYTLPDEQMSVAIARIAAAYHAVTGVPGGDAETAETMPVL